MTFSVTHRTALVALVLLLAVPLGAAAGASATVDGDVLDAAEANTTTPTPDAPAGANTSERIDPATVLVSSSYDNTTQTATLTIRSEIPQTIVFSDSSDFVLGGTVNTRTVQISPGSTETWEFPAGNVSGYVGIGISTRQSLYSEVISNFETGSVDVPDSTWGAVVLGSGGAIFATLAVVSLVIWYRSKQDDESQQKEILAQ